MDKSGKKYSLITLPNVELRKKSTKVGAVNDDIKDIIKLNARLTQGSAHNLPHSA